MVVRMGRIGDPAKRLRVAQGQKIRNARRFRGLTHAQVAEAMKPPVTPGAISQWETGRTSPRSHHQIALARALDVEWSSLFGLDEVA